MQPKGFIFDLDGVITDTARYHYLAWKRLADELGYHFSENDNERLKGVDRMSSLEIILEINGVSDKHSNEEKVILADRKNFYYNELLDEVSSKDILENIPEFLSEAKSRGIKMAIASISKNAVRILDQLGIMNMFDYIADPEMIKDPKPAPEIFAVCADALGLAPPECIGFEDAQAGICAIHAANIFSVGIGVNVTCLVPDLILSSTKELDMKKVINAYEMMSVRL